MPSQFVIGIDVTARHARAGVFDLKGNLIAQAVSRPIPTHSPGPHIIEQCSTDIWKAVCGAVKTAVKQAEVPAGKISAIAFDAIGSLVAADSNDKPVSLSTRTDKNDLNVIVWNDLRAEKETALINKKNHEVLRYLGETMLPEHQIAKLLWIRKNLPKSWKNAARFFDLSDWLTYRATGRDVRSLCTGVTRWSYLAHEKTEEARRQGEFFNQIGLGDLLKHRKLGESMEAIGECVGGLNYFSAHDLGLETGTPVAVSVVDSYAGALGLLGNLNHGKDKGESPEKYNNVFCLLSGSNSCQLALSTKPRFVKGIPGPFFNTLLPNVWFHSTGQNGTGRLLESVITGHPAYSEILKESKAANVPVYEILNAKIKQLAEIQKLPHHCRLTKDIHILPYYLGNRSPHSDPHASGAVHGLTLHSDLHNYLRTYYGTIQAIAYETREIILNLNANGYKISQIHACGPDTRNPLWVQELADITGCEIIVTEETETILLGSAILAAVGSGYHKSLSAAMNAMKKPVRSIFPDKKTAAYHKLKFSVFREMYADQKKYAEMMTR